MNDAFSMGGFERVGDLDSQLQHFLKGHRLAGDIVLEGLAVEKLHCNELLPVFFADVINSADVGMIEGGRRLSFAPESLESGGVVGLLTRQEFQCDCTMKPRILALVDDTHASAAKLFEGAIVRDRRSELFPQN